MKLIKYTVLLSMLALLSSVFALARDNNQHSVEIPDFYKSVAPVCNLATTRSSGKGPAQRYRLISCVMERPLPQCREH